MLDGIPLGQLGMEGTSNNNALPLTVVAAVTFTPNLPPVDINAVGLRPLVHSLDSAPFLPKAVVIGCAEGSCNWALDDIFEFTGVTDHNWRTLKCVRANGMATGAMFKRTSPGDPDCGSLVRSLKPEAIIKKTSTRTSKLEEGPQGLTRAATAIVQALIPSQAHHLIPEITPCLLKSATWTANFSPTAVDNRVLLESGRDVSPTSRSPLNQEKNIRCLCPKLSKRGGTLH